ncbi:MAG: ABC transporter ATP-binding protein [Clostridia bacterium]|nr:ABC transporter ATP-binding protein [Clostridia bacterium]
MKKKEKDPQIHMLSNYCAAFKLMLKLFPEKFAGTLFLTIFGNVINFFSFTYILSFVVNGLQIGRRISVLMTYVVGMMTLQIIISTFENVFSTYILPILDQKCSLRVNRMLYKKSVESDISNYESPEMYALFGRAVSGGVGSIEWVFWSISNIVGMIINLGLSSWLTLTIDPFLFVFAVLPIFFNLLRKKISKKKREFDVESSEIIRKRDYTQRVFYQNEFAKELRLTNIYRVMLRRFREAIDEYLHLVRTKGMKLALMQFVITFGTNILSITGAQIYTVYRALVSNTVMIGDCLVVLNTISSISYNIQYIGSQVSYIHNICYSFQDYRNFMWREEKIGANENGEKAAAGDIELRDVTFRYLGADEDTLHSLNMTIKQGEKIAIVGFNGAGKTTLVKLLMRLYDPSSGEILLNGRNIKEYNLESYRGSLGVVFQDYKQFALSVAENVLGRPMREGDEATVEDCLRRAGIWDKISALPEGINTRMTREFDDDGLILSGGESQKLAIASVYARNSSVVILDEPSSALDPIAEHEMYRQMYRACEGKTMIFISHRLSSAVDADRIFLIEDGSIKESGSHSELMRLNGSYAEMFKAQAESYTDA